MSLFPDLSFRYKIPLRGAALILITTTLLAGSLIFRVHQDLKQDVIFDAESLSRLLAKTLIAPLTHDDVWRAYEIINSPFTTFGNNNPKTAEYIVVLDRLNRVYIATQPTHFPILSNPGRDNPDFDQLQGALSGSRESKMQQIEPPNSEMMYMLTPIVSDGTVLGTLIMAYSKSAFLPRFFETVLNGAVIELLVLTLVIPASWIWAQRFAEPMVKLAKIMGRVGSSIPDDAEIPIKESGDELGQLATAFKVMLKGLREKESLEKQVILSERLAAIGRLSAAIAHEINNPLGGILNALSTFKHHGNNDPMTLRTLSLIERGLMQIKETTSALLVEAGQRSYDLTCDDIEDIRTLVLPQTKHKNANFQWHNEAYEALPLPAAPVRQILINLLLNAVHAIAEFGHMKCTITIDHGALRMVVANDGDHIPHESMKTLFEPFHTQHESGHGLGLWITYQLVHQLDGTISVASRPGETSFTVLLPFLKASS